MPASKGPRKHHNIGGYAAVPISGSRDVRSITRDAGADVAEVSEALTTLFQASVKLHTAMARDASDFVREEFSRPFDESQKRVDELLARSTSLADRKKESSADLEVGRQKLMEAEFRISEMEDLLAQLRSQADSLKEHLHSLEATEASLTKESEEVTQHLGVAQEEAAQVNLRLAAALASPEERESSKRRALEGLREEMMQLLSRVCQF
ncbi:hypothetical protein MRB53_036701 [Persea americana]|nr:hypothetical protein MRB53_036701 [Persea americana]